MTVSCFLCIASLFLSPELGTKVFWKGYVTQYSSYSLASKYDFELRITEETSVPGGIKGETTIRMQDASGMYAVIEFEGVINGTDITIQESKIKEQNIRSGAWWCIKKLVLKRSEADGKVVLTGTWDSPQCIGDGDVYLERIEAQK